MVEKILNNTTPYGKIRASHEGSLHSSTLTPFILGIEPQVVVWQSITLPPRHASSLKIMTKVISYTLDLVHAIYHSIA